MVPLLIDLFDAPVLAASLARILDAEIGVLETRRFPDGESYVRYASDPARRPVILLGSLDRPDEKFLPLVFAAAAARELGASHVGLVCPYLAYMRQDRRFQKGEAVTSAYFAQSLSPWIDWLLTVDPHLHRRTSLSEIYSVPAASVHAAPAISAWIRREVERPLLIGPDIESEQWVASVAADAGAPFTVLRKVRRGDRDVEISVPDVAKLEDRTPVLVDDIVSTARTMIETIGHLHRARLPPAICVAVHGVFAGTAYQDMLDAGAANVISTNTVPHETGRIDISKLLAEGIREIMA